MCHSHSPNTLSGKTLLRLCHRSNTIVTFSCTCFGCGLHASFDTSTGLACPESAIVLADRSVEPQPPVAARFRSSPRHHQIASRLYATARGGDVLASGSSPFIASSSSFQPSPGVKWAASPTEETGTSSLLTDGQRTRYRNNWGTAGRLLSRGWGEPRSGSVVSSGSVSCCQHTSGKFQKRRKQCAAFGRALTFPSVVANSVLSPRCYGRARQRRTWQQSQRQTSAPRGAGYRASMSRPVVCSPRCSTKSLNANSPPAAGE